MRFMMVMAAALALGACSMGQDMASTDAAVGDFHKQLDAGQYAAITDAAGPEIKNSGTDFNALLEMVHTKLGAFKSTQRQGFNDNVNNGDHTFSVSYASVYATGPATESFVYRMNGGKPGLVGYHVESKALMAPSPAPSGENAAEPAPAASDSPASDDTASDDAKPAEGGH